MNNRNLYTPRDIFAAARDDAEVSNLLNTDMYKFMMMDFILAHPEYKDVNVRRDLKIRSKNVRTADVIPLQALIDQLEATKAIQGVSEADLSFLRGMKQPNGTPLFREKTLDFLKNFRFCDYNKIGVDETGNYTLSFTGPRQTSMMREIAGLKIINSLYLYHYTKKAKLNDSEFNYIINKSLGRLYDDIAIFKTAPGLKYMEFGTRRSMSTDYQRMIVQILSDMNPEQLATTSNVMIAKELGSNNPGGTNAHEPRMVKTALVDDPKEIIDTMYSFDRERQKHYPGLGILLPDTYGSSFYFNNCPEDIALGHNGTRIDSKDPFLAIPEYLEFLKKRNLDAQKKLALPSDGLTAKTSVEIYNAFSDKIPVKTGNGTHLSNNTVGTRPRAEEPFGHFGAFSVVIKPAAAQRADGTRVPCVKLSDNFEKATEGKVPGYQTITGQSRVAFFKDIFGNAGVESHKVLV